MTSSSPPSSAQVTRIVVLGTGTGVGKTWVTRTLSEALRRVGAWVLALKPVESGVIPTAVTDASLLASASSEPPTPPPFVFSDAISPHLAARRAGSSIEIGSVLDYVRRSENSMTSHVTPFILVECAGGCFSPLAPGVTNEDLARALEPAIWILVAPDALGVLHDVSATLGALGARGRMPDYVVLSAAREPDASTGTNAQELASLAIAAPIATVGRGNTRALDELAERLVVRASHATAKS